MLPIRVRLCPASVSGEDSYAGQPQPHPRLPLDQLDQVGEVALPQPRADRGDERLRDLRRDRDGDTGFPRDVEQEARVLGGQG